MVIRCPCGVLFLPKTQIDQGNQYRPNISELKGINFLSQTSPISDRIFISSGGKIQHTGTGKTKYRSK